MELKKIKHTLENGKSIKYEYDQEGDILEIVFRSTPETAAIELTESIILHFDWKTNEPVRLSFISFSRLIQPTEYGETHFQLLANEWPEEMQKTIWELLRNPPLSEFLKLSSFTPSHTRQPIPVTSIKRPAMMGVGA